MDREGRGEGRAVSRIERASETRETGTRDVGRKKKSNRCRLELPLRCTSLSNCEAGGKRTASCSRGRRLEGRRGVVKTEGARTNASAIKKTRAMVFFSPFGFSEKPKEKRTCSSSPPKSADAAATSPAARPLPRGEGSGAGSGGGMAWRIRERGPLDSPWRAREERTVFFVC